MGKSRDPKVAILPSTTRKGTTLSTSAALDSPSVISQLVSPPQAAHAGTSAESENSYNIDDASAVLDDSGSLGSFLDATIARSRQIENTETPNENTATPVNSPESVEYSSDDLDEDYVALDDDFVDKCNAATDAKMASPINFNQFLEKEKLKSNGSNFTDWFRHSGIDLQKRFEHHDPHELMNELKAIFETHAAVECYEASKHFFSCMMEEGSSVSEHMLAMTGHAKKLSDLGIVIPNRLGINRVLQSLPPSYKNFVMNYNMQNMNKELPELFGMLKAAEIEIKKEHQVLMVNKTTSFKKQGKSKGKFKKGGKKAATPPMKPKNGPKHDAECYCKEKGQGVIAPSIWLIEERPCQEEERTYIDIHVIDVYLMVLVLVLGI
ncbi:hypothetical protein QYE76_060064 [Lolium multiflorum]|uniref:Zinc finger, CCHC-type n=1 Tax=Lolium multiflorum TaxID=4521 RepID=A0AAD8W5W6_LOLMU|nr:hypothetical protein QYE76_060064 [Lolium multiflorum]